MKICLACQCLFVWIGCPTLLSWNQNAIVDAFTVARPHSQLRHVGGVDTTTMRHPFRLHGSLEGHVNQVSAAAMDSGSSTIMPSAVLEPFQALQVESLFSDGWFKALSLAMHDSIILMAQMPIWLEAAILLTPVFVIAHLYLYRLAHPPANYRRGMEPYLRGAYDPVQARKYYSQHPLLVARRLAELLRLSNQWLAHYLTERYVWKNEEQHREARAQELLGLINHLGPTAVKIGQALSVRHDILPEEYSNALSTLQDNVPPFDSEHAKQILRRELGPDKFAKLHGLEQGPVASASIGQVYKCTLHGEKVAVKVQVRT